MTLLPFDLPAVQRKKVTADFEGGPISSDGGLVLLREAERRLALADALAGCIREWRDPARTVHPLPAMLRFRMFAIACGYEDADDWDDLRADLLFKLADAWVPESGRDLCSQPTMSRLENAPSLSEVGSLTGLWSTSSVAPSRSRRRRSRSTSTTPATRCTAINSSRCLGPLFSGAARPANTRPFNPNSDTDELKSRRFERAEHNPLHAQKQAIISAFQE